MLDTMTLARLADHQRYWRRNPPLHQLVAAFLDYKPPYDGEGDPVSIETLPDFEPGAERHG